MTVATKEKSQAQSANGSSNGYRVLGTRPIRHDGLDKVTGRAKYGADSYPAGVLYGKILRSPHAHARILSLDTSKAEAHPGVTAVITSADMAAVADKIQEMGEDAVNLQYLSANILAKEKVLYHGHPIVALSALSSHVAEEALALIEIEYEILPHVQDVRAAMQDDAPILLENLRTDSMGKRGDKPTNIASHHQHKLGDLEAGFAAADVIVEREYKTAMVHQGYLEPQASTVHYHSDGTIDVWTSTQGAFQIRSQVSELLDIPVSKIKVTPAEIGGGFGGKFTAYLDVPSALLSKKSGYRPVRMAMTRTEVLLATGPTSGSYIRVKMGATNSGKITAAEAELVYESGAYPGSPVGAGTRTILAPYNIENVQLDGYDVVVNKTKTAAYRAPGATNAAYASECLVDELSEKLGMDPLEFRRINASKEGTRRADGPTYDRIGFEETVVACQEHDHYTTPLEGKYRGRGVASGFWFNGGGRSSVSASVDQDGRVSLIEGSTDIGGSRSSVAMQLAEVLGIDAEDVNPQVADTNSVGYNDGTGGSRVTFATGYAAYEVAHKLKDIMCNGMAEVWDMEPSEVKLENGIFTAGDNSSTFREVATELSNSATPVVASASIRPSKPGAGFGTHIVDIEVDPDTGKVTILRYTATQDVGKAIHPSYVEGQIQGGVAQGIGWALNEEYFYDENGRLRNFSLLDYRMPTALDLPMIETVLVEVPNPGHPYGVRGVGEVPIVPPVAAVANAIYQATGKRMYELPMSPMKVIEAMMGDVE